MEKIKCVNNLSAYLTVDKVYNVLKEDSNYYLVKDDLNNSVWLKKSRFMEVA